MHGGINLRKPPGGWCETDPCSRGGSSRRQMRRLCGCSRSLLRTRVAATASAEEQEALAELRRPLEGAPGRPPMVALGKFDALHKGHRALVEQAAQMGGSPWLLSFSGMAQVLGWPPRPPLVAEADRQRVLDSWAPLCGGQRPRQRSLPFAAVRGMSPEEFVHLLAHHLQVAGVVVGRGYRFGYKQAGDTQLLQQLGKAAGMRVTVSELIGPATPGLVGKVSSSEVRRALQQGRIGRVRDYLGRQYRLVGALDACPQQAPLRLPCAAFQNQLPAEREYAADVQIQASSDAGQTVSLAGCQVLVGPSEVALTHERLRGAAPVPDGPVTVHIDFC